MGEIVEYNQLEDPALSINSLWQDGLISVRLRNALLNSDLKDFTQILEIPFSGFNNVAHFGKKSLDELYDFVTDMVAEDARDRYPFFRVDSLKIPPEFFSTPIKNLRFSKRTKNGLTKAGLTTLGALHKRTRQDVWIMCKGLGEKCLDEIFESKIIEDYITRNNQDELVQTLTPAMQLEVCDTISGFVKKNFTQNYYDLFFGKYNDNLTDILREYGITKQRAHQKIRKVLHGVENGFAAKQIAPYILNSFKDKVKSGWKLVAGHDIDPEIDNFGIARLLCDCFPTDFRIVRAHYLHHRWVVGASRKIDKEVKALRNYLNQTGYYQKDELLEHTGLSYDFIKDLAGVYEYGDFFSNSTSEKYFNIIKYLNENDLGVFTIEDISRHFNFDEDYVRSTMMRLPRVINVGLSKYKMLDEATVRNNEPYKTLDIIVNAIKQAGHPLDKQKLINEVLSIREISKNSVIQAVYQNSDVVVEIDDGKIALVEWGYAPKENKRVDYKNKLDDVVLEILKTTHSPLTVRDLAKEILARYGDTASSNTVSIYAALQRMKRAYPIVQEMHEGEAKYYISNN